MKKLIYGIALLALATAPAALADPGDPPSRVARLNYRSGTVSFRPGSVEEWTEATLNYPLTTGDNLWTERGAQSEMHVGSTAIRMASETALSFLNLDDNTLQLSLTDGSINVHVRDLAFNEVVEVDTPNAAISLLRPGDYRIDADADRAVTTISVRDGEADVTSGGASFPVRMGASARLTGTDQVTQEIGPLPRTGEFDRWCEARDRREAQSVSARYVSREMIGYEDLDEYGVWRDMPPYGWVWMPSRMSAGWAPYHYGHWAWVFPWGWTWIDDSPWGFAPFHYGRWAYASAGWCWIPGSMSARPVYAPALVVFAGGTGFGRFGPTGGVAWFPLGPGEVYRPGYRVSDAYVRRVNIMHVSVTNINVTNVRYVNRDVRGGVTAVPRDVFVQARPVGRAGITMDPREMARMEVSSAAPFAPRRESILAQSDPRRLNGPPARIVGRAVVARTAPPPPPVPFAAQQRALEANQGRPLDAGAMENLRRTAQPRGPEVRTFQQPQGGWRQARPAEAQQSPRPAVQTNPGMERPQRAVEPQQRPQNTDAPRNLETRPNPAARPQRDAQPQVQPPPVQQPQVQQPPANPRTLEQRPVYQNAPAERQQRNVEQRPVVPNPPADRPQRNIEQRPAVPNPPADRPQRNIEQRPVVPNPPADRPQRNIEQRPVVPNPPADRPQRMEQRTQPATPRQEQPRTERPAGAAKGNREAKPDKAEPAKPKQ